MIEAVSKRQISRVDLPPLSHCTSKNTIPPLCMGWKLHGAMGGSLKPSFAVGPWRAAQGKTLGKKPLHLLVKERIVELPALTLWVFFARGWRQSKTDNELC